VITQEQVKELFNYDPGTGVLTRKIRTSQCVQIGDIAGCVNAGGYLVVGINSKLYQNHRIAFLHHHGYLPKFLDHINGDGSDNRIINLRECAISQNNQNAKLRSDNTSGIKGVSWDEARKKWMAQLSIDGKNQYLGRFKKLSKAESAVKIARKKYHGEFANHGAKLKQIELPVC
jgi:hypothetical protein